MLVKDLLKRPDLIGCELENQMESLVCRGPIKSIERNGRKIVIELDWTAVKEGNEWEDWPFNGVNHYASAKLDDLGEGRLGFGDVGKDYYVIYPKSQSILDPSKIKNFSLD